MPDLQQIIDGLGCLTTHQHPCRDCPFNPYPGRSWAYGCGRGQDDIVDAAREALRELREVRGNMNHTDWETRVEEYAERTNADWMDAEENGDGEVDEWHADRW